MGAFLPLSRLTIGVTTHADNGGAIATILHQPSLRPRSPESCPPLVRIRGRYRAFLDGLLELGYLYRYLSRGVQVADPQGFSQEIGSKGDYGEESQ